MKCSVKTIVTLNAAEAKVLRDFAYMLEDYNIELSGDALLNTIKNRDGYCRDDLDNEFKINYTEEIEED